MSKECCRIEIEKVENGFTICKWEKEEGDMYSEPTKYVAETKEEALKILEENLT